MNKKLKASLLFLVFFCMTLLVAGVVLVYIIKRASEEYKPVVEYRADLLSDNDCNWKVGKELFCLENRTIRSDEYGHAVINVNFVSNEVLTTPPKEWYK